MFQPVALLQFGQRRCEHLVLPKFGDAGSPAQRRDMDDVGTRLGDHPGNGAAKPLVGRFMGIGLDLLAMGGEDGPQVDCLVDVGVGHGAGDLASGDGVQHGEGKRKPGDHAGRLGQRGRRFAVVSLVDGREIVGAPREETLAACGIHCHHGLARHLAHRPEQVVEGLEGEGRVRLPVLGRHRLGIALYVGRPGVDHAGFAAVLFGQQEIAHDIGLYTAHQAAPEYWNNKRVITEITPVYRRRFRVV